MPVAEWYTELDVGWVVGIEVRSRSYRKEFTAKTLRREEKKKRLTAKVWKDSRKDAKEGRSGDRILQGSYG
jgi:hypothetical protein